jgi:hypothetical protein
VIQCKISEKRNKLEQLEKGICEGVGDVSFKTGKCSLVVESIDGE